MPAGQPLQPQSCGSLPVGFQPELENNWEHMCFVWESHLDSLLPTFLAALRVSGNSLALCGPVAVTTHLPLLSKETPCRDDLLSALWF